MANWILASARLSPLPKLQVDDSLSTQSIVLILPLHHTVFVPSPQNTSTFVLLFRQGTGMVLAQDEQPCDNFQRLQT